MNDETQQGGMKINWGRLIAYSAAAATLCIAMYAGCNGCSSSNNSNHTKKEQIQATPPEKLEETILQLAPVERARVVKYIEDKDLLDEKLAYSAHVYFMESYKRQESKR